MKLNTAACAEGNQNRGADNFMVNNDHSNWFLKFKKTKEYEAFVKAPVAYFCAEYALDSSLPTYAGGLGILAGDYIREAAIRGFPLVAVGLRYQRGQSTLSPDGETDKDKDKIKKVVDENHRDVIISVPIENRTVRVKAWQWQEDNARVYLLDTDVAENDSRDREITRCLYDENRDTRLKQEIILGLAGFRLLARLGYHASVYHLNEGHSAFLALELIRHEMDHQRVNFKEACEYAKKHILFTNHTLALAGQEQFSTEKVDRYTELCAKDICLNSKEISNLGSLQNNPNIFSMTAFSFRLSAKSNAVSELHYQKAKEIWPNQDMQRVSNGIFLKRWDKIKNTSNIWRSHLENKRKLLSLVKDKTGETWSETDLVFVWARRLVEYKQPLFFLNNPEKLLEICKNSPVPIRIIFSGPTGESVDLLEKEIQKIITEKLQEVAVFIPGYNMDLAEILTAGADVWLNTPITGTEACGTSGMKAALNGVLALSTNDGWVSEVNPVDIGWVINDFQSSGEMYTLVKEKIIPVYYAHLKNPKDSMWLKKMTQARNLILENFSTLRVLREYIEKLYIPTLKQKHTHKID